MTIVFYFHRVYLKEWPNWTGVIPRIGDTVFLHFERSNEEPSKFKVVDVTISGAEPDKIRIDLESL